MTVTRPNRNNCGKYFQHDFFFNFSGVKCCNYTSKIAQIKENSKIDILFNRYLLIH